VVSPERPSLALPAELDRRAMELLTGEGDWQPPPVHDAATLILLRSGESGLEVLLQKRPTAMAFAAGMYVFPGGRVEVSDADPDVPWQGPVDYEPFPVTGDAQPTAHFRALTVAAVRETWEEAGIALLTSEPAPPRDSNVEFLSLLREMNCAVAGDLLWPWVHWVTPEVERRRFDVRFLVAQVPHGAEGADMSSETEETRWVTPKEAVAAATTGEMPMLPPTTDALAQLVGFPDPQSVLAAARTRRPRPLLPRPWRVVDGVVQWRLEDAYTGEVISS
jgi:8-oxo-dGTP pyrophosphatase MutT (NUDIX family)